MMGHLVFGRYSRETLLPLTKARVRTWRAWLAANFGRRSTH